ncbi:MAG TPA: D-alanine--D-alanine ligase [Candidatus Paceibacterota bacterium]
MGLISVGVLRGGPSSEHEVSLRSGESVLENIPKDKYLPRDIIITKEGEWFSRGVETRPERVSREVDVIFNCLHGEYGEDGKVQQILERHKIPYTGSGVFASAAGMNKIISRNIFERHGLLVPRGIVVKNGEDPEEAARIILRNMPPLWVIKPSRGGSSIGVTIASTFSDLISALGESLRYGDQILVEERVEGREITCGLIEGFRGEEYYVLPPIEIIPHRGRKFFDYEAKYRGQSRELCPAPLQKDLRDEIMRLAVEAHKAIGCRHYSRSDFIICSSQGKEGEIYALEINTLPGLTSGSLIPKALEAVGATRGQFLDHLISMAMRGGAS